MPERAKDTYKGNQTGKRGQGPPDPNVKAWSVVQQAIGEMPKEPLPRSLRASRSVVWAA